MAVYQDRATKRKTKNGEAEKAERGPDVFGYNGLMQPLGFNGLSQNQDFTFNSLVYAGMSL